MCVSLFTREWIEIPIFSASGARPSMSPSLRGSGLKLWLRPQKQSKQRVSLFTREWIEIFSEQHCLARFCVSLFTREWIEIENELTGTDAVRSPSLRGSGLK